MRDTLQNIRQLILFHHQRGIKQLEITKAVNVPKSSVSDILRKLTTTKNIKSGRKNNGRSRCFSLLRCRLRSRSGGRRRSRGTPWSNMPGLLAIVAGDHSIGLVRAAFRGWSRNRGRRGTLLEGRRRLGCLIDSGDRLGHLLALARVLLQEKTEKENKSISKVA